MLYVSFTCLPSRYENLPHVLAGIQEQTIIPDVVIIQYPKQCLRMNTPYKDIQHLLQNQYKFRLVINYTNDYGPMTKLYPLINMNLKPDDLIIIIDDDNKYNPLLIECLLKNFLHAEQKKCICMSGLIYPTSLDFPYYCSRGGNETQIMEAAFGYIIKRSFLDDDFHKWVPQFNSYDDVKKASWENSFLSDDFVFSKYLDTKNIAKQVAYFHPLVEKNNVFMKSTCNSNDALSATGHNLDKYFYSTYELEKKALISATITVDRNS